MGLIILGLEKGIVLHFCGVGLQRPQSWTISSLLVWGICFILGYLGSLGMCRSQHRMLSSLRRQGVGCDEASRGRAAMQAMPDPYHILYTIYHIFYIPYTIIYMFRYIYIATWSLLLSLGTVLSTCRTLSLQLAQSRSCFYT